MFINIFEHLRNMLFNYNMKDNDKIKHFPIKKIKTGFFNNKNKLAEIKNFQGFEYVKLKKDVNGISFNKKALEDFAFSLKYTISIMRDTNNGIFLYEYFINGEDFDNFFKLYIDGTIEGKIVQIEKHTPDNLA